jgi:hypothetical protein
MESKMKDEAECRGLFRQARPGGGRALAWIRVPSRESGVVANCLISKSFRMTDPRSIVPGPPPRSAAATGASHPVAGLSLLENRISLEIDASLLVMRASPRAEGFSPAHSLRGWNANR